MVEAQLAPAAQDVGKGAVPEADQALDLGDGAAVTRKTLPQRPQELLFRVGARRSRSPFLLHGPKFWMAGAGRKRGLGAPPKAWSPANRQQEARPHQFFVAACKRSLARWKGWRECVAMNQIDQSEFWQRTFSTLPVSDVSGFSYRSVPQLPAGEYDQFVEAWRLLASGNVLSLTRDGDIALAGAGVCEALLARSWAARYHDAGEMLRFASAAQIVARGLKTSDLGIAGVAALQARAWGELANALRVAGKSTEAASAFDEAFDREGDYRDPHLSAHLLQMRATLYGSSGDPAFAAQLLELVTRFYDEADEGHLGGRARVAQSIHASRAGDKQAAILLNLEGLRRVDRMRDPALVMAALHNRMLLLLTLGRKEEARETARFRADCDSSGPVAMRLRWMEGRILQSLGELEEAEQALRESRDGLSVLRLQLFTAMASLDLSETLLLQDRIQEAKAEALAGERILLGLENREKYYAALLVLEAAFSSSGAPIEQIQRALAILRDKVAGS